MKRIILLYLFLINVIISYGEDFKILYLSTDSIKIGNSYLHKNGIFQSSDTIYWNQDNDMEYMSVQNMTTYIQKVIDRESLNGYKSLAEFEEHANDEQSLLSTIFNSFKSFISYYINPDNHTSYRDGEKVEGLQYMEELLCQTYFLDQTISIPFLIPDPDNCVVVLEFIYDDIQYSIPLTIEDSCIIISKDLLQDSLELKENLELKCNIRLLVQERDIVLSDTLVIIIN